MSDQNKLKLSIKKLYGETIEIKQHKAIGWYSHHYNIIRPDDMDQDTFLELFEKIRNDFPDTKLKTIEKNMYCEITNQDLSTIDRIDLNIVILTDDVQNMNKLATKMTLTKLQTKK